MTRFLIVRLGALGDVVHAIPVAAALRRAYPAARIDWLVSAKHREILDLVPVIDRRLVINDRPAGSGREKGAGSSLWSAMGELRRGGDLPVAPASLGHRALLLVQDSVLRRAP